MQFYTAFNVILTPNTKMASAAPPPDEMRASERRERWIRYRLDERHARAAKFVDNFVDKSETT